MKESRLPPVLAGVAGLAALLAYAAFASPYLIAAGFAIVLFVTLAASWNLVSGYTGYVSFGHVVFFGIGAYTASLLVTKGGLGWLPATLAAASASAVLALVLGAITLRLKGAYFAIAMLGASEAVRVVASTWESLTGGGSGITLPNLLSPRGAFLLLGLTALGTIILTYVVAQSRFGLHLLAIREDETGAEAMGVAAARAKTAAFVLSAIPAGIAGAANAWHINYIDPESTFPILLTIQMIVMTMLGGGGTVLGPVVGALILGLAGEFLWARFPFVHLGLYGLLIVGIVIFIPEGLLPRLMTRGILPRTRRL